MVLWITTDRLGTLLHEKKPIIGTFHGIKYYQSTGKIYMLSNELFPKLTFENGPQKIKINTDDLDLFEKLPHLNRHIKVIEDRGYAPCLYYLDGEWCISWIDCKTRDALVNFYSHSPRITIQKAFDWCVKLKLINQL